MPTGASVPISYMRYEAGRWGTVADGIVNEQQVRVHVNGQEWLMLMCTPQHLDWLVVGLLASEGVIRERADVRRIVVCPSGTCVEVWLTDANAVLPTQAVRTSGCGGGVAFGDLTASVAPLNSSVRISPAQLARLMQAIYEVQETRGIHTSALSDGQRLLVVVEDVGRHNTLDKLWGHCLLAGIPTRDRLLLSTGRISSEMLKKAGRMEVPVVASRTSPTSLAVALASAWRITLVGYLRRDSLNVYTEQARIVAEDNEKERADAYAR